MVARQRLEGRPPATLWWAAWTMRHAARTRRALTGGAVRRRSAWMRPCRYVTALPAGWKAQPHCETGHSHLARLRLRLRVVLLVLVFVACRCARLLACMRARLLVRSLFCLHPAACSSELAALHDESVRDRRVVRAIAHPTACASPAPGVGAPRKCASSARLRARAAGPVPFRSQRRKCAARVRLRARQAHAGVAADGS
jgi:hypothetical protein